MLLANRLLLRAPAWMKSPPVYRLGNALRSFGPSNLQVIQHKPLIFIMFWSLSQGTATMYDRERMVEAE